MRGGAQPPATPAGQHVAEVDDEHAAPRMHRDPAPAPLLHLEAAHLILRQQRQQSVVGVCTHAEHRIGRRRALRFIGL
eukprot:CAMPEP_0177656234 /NCGR_PEP_ID=MMETSP0447-20121125/15436_1 /TAXON_ID=0 /ORGANISM="Stygamoeba regulata, Strain BSH-02190019" /LENGTH=77 /DNA_ID=CAMNT_0019160295 /DNA_START=465 /DNA_END=698 /DNA_ORIENTATION=-